MDTMEKAQSMKFCYDQTLMNCVSYVLIKLTNQ